MYCMHCGEQISDNSKYCKYCGKYVGEGFNDLGADIEEDYEETPAFSETVAEAEPEPVVEVKPEAVPVIDDIFLVHMPRGKKILLFFAAIIMTAVTAAMVFAIFFPELI